MIEAVLPISTNHIDNGRIDNIWQLQLTNIDPVFSLQSTHQRISAPSCSAEEHKAPSEKAITDFAASAVTNKVHG